MQPLVLGLGVGIGIGGGSRLDVDAQVYIAAIEGDGVTVTGAQKVALSDFVVAQKASGAWANQKRLFLPIWGVVAANARCMISAASGTFTGMTHAAGYVQGNGTSEYFDAGVAMGALGMTNADFNMTHLVYAAHAGAGNGKVISGIYDSPDYFAMTSQYATDMRNVRFASPARDNTDTFARTSHNGILISTRAGGDDLILRRSNSGFATVFTYTVAASGNLPTSNLIYGGLNSGGTAVSFTDSKFSAAAYGLGMSVSEASAFSADLETLFEACTGLSLP